MANGCSGTDRSDCYWRCGAKSHFAKDCKATYVEARNLGETVAKERFTRMDKDAQEKRLEDSRTPSPI